ncbi:MAG: DISARM system phospholipase D-like protein DrmC [Chloroflexota bacterium]
MTGIAALSTAIQRLVRRLPTSMPHGIATLMAASPPGSWSPLKSQLYTALPQPDLRAEIDSLFAVWQAQCSQLSPESVALALLAAAEVEARYRAEQTVELVWTGPRDLGTPARRTDQVLLQMINEAQHHLHIVSFAVYKARGIVQALSRAAERGVEIGLYLESEEVSDGKIRFEPMKAFGDALLEHADLFIWPLAQREHTADGRYGSLHAKIASADGLVMLVSSANLTDYALSLNIEAGILIRGGSLPAQMEGYLLQLVESGVFRRTSL